MKKRFLFALSICLTLIFGVVLAWKDTSIMPTNYSVIDTSSNPQIKVGVLFIDKIFDTLEENYYLSLKDEKISANLAGAFRIGNVESDCNNGLEGTISYDQAQKKVEICIEEEWRVLNTETVLGVSIIGNHSYEECIEKSGAMVNVLEGKLCFFEGKSCPSGWTQYKSYSSTHPSIGQGCSVYYNKNFGAETCPCIPETPCVTGFHTYQNRAPETCVSPGYYRAGDSGCYKYKQPVTVTAVAEIHQVGCY